MKNRIENKHSSQEKGSNLKLYSHRYTIDFSIGGEKRPYLIIIRYSRHSFFARLKEVGKNAVVLLHPYGVLTSGWFYFANTLSNRRKTMTVAG